MRLYSFFVYIVVFGAIVAAAILFQLEGDKTIFVTILGVATFLFGIFVAFSVSDRHNRIDRIMEHDSIERSQLVMLYHNAKVFGESFVEKVQKAIDQYLMATLDLEIWDYYMTEKDFVRIVDLINSVEIEDDKQSAVYGEMLDVTGTIGVARKQTIGEIGDRLSRFEWWMLLLLALVIVASLLAVNTGSVISIVIVCALSFAVVFVLELLYLLDQLKWKEEERIFEPYEKTFEAVGLMRYYHEDLVNGGRAKFARGKTYRKGVFPKPYPDLSGKKIVVVEG